MPVLFLALPIQLELPLLLLCSLLAWRIRGHGELILLIVSVFVTLGMAELAIRLLDAPDRAYFRPHERLLRSLHYQPGVQVEMLIPHGDLVAIDPLAPYSITDRRRVHFQTDQLGMRNDADYAGEQYVLVGDSFVVGNGNDQAHTLTSTLRREHGLSTYALAFPAPPSQYYVLADRFLQSTNPDARLLLFLFEGNDFSLKERSPNEIEASSWDMNRKLMLAGLGNPLRLSDLTFGASRRAWRMLWPVRGAVVDVLHTPAGHIGFLGHYVERAKESEQSLDIEQSPAIRERVERAIACIFFIPTKYRVYAPLLDEPALPEPAPALRAIERYYQSLSVPVVDLTPSLRRRARVLFEEKRTVFWRDDTHWNAEGITVAAGEVARWLSKL